MGLQSTPEIFCRTEACYGRRFQKPAGRYGPRGGAIPKRQRLPPAVTQSRHSEPHILQASSGRRLSPAKPWLPDPLASGGGRAPLLAAWGRKALKPQQPPPGQRSEAKRDLPGTGPEASGEIALTDVRDPTDEAQHSEVEVLLPKWTVGGHRVNSILRAQGCLLCPLQEIALRRNAFRTIHQQGARSALPSCPSGTWHLHHDGSVYVWFFGLLLSEHCGTVLPFRLFNRFLHADRVENQFELFKDLYGMP
jgi:hypothetical protein